MTSRFILNLHLQAARTRPENTTRAQLTTFHGGNPLTSFALPVTWQQASDFDDSDREPEYRKAYHIELPTTTETRVRQTQDC